MRSKFWVSAAIASLGLFGSFGSLAHAAGAKPKAKDARHAPDAKPLELHADDKSIKKQTQWEDKVMGPDSKRSELDKIARARAINEKAQQDKEKQSALEAAEPAAKALPASKKNEKPEVSLISPEKNEPARAHDISPKLETASAQAAPAPSKPADDKFIDKLLRDEDAPTKKHEAASSSDKELEALLSGAKDKPHKKGDSVDDIIKNADKGPAMPAPRAQSGGLPEWAKQPEISSPPPAAPPVAVAPPVKKKNDGVIQVVQGAAGNAPAIVSQSSSSGPAPRGRKVVAKAPAKAAPVEWSDPFAEKSPVAQASAPKKEAASHPSAAPATSWNDPFAVDPAETRKSVHRAAPTTTSSPAAPTSAPKRNDKAEPAARPASWKEPFTAAPAPAPRAPVAMRELGKSESGKWDVATRRPSPHTSASDGHTATGWGVLKKRSR
jgi:hypothetical protein